MHSSFFHSFVLSYYIFFSPFVTDLNLNFSNFGRSIKSSHCAGLDFKEKYQSSKYFPLRPFSFIQRTSANTTQCSCIHSKAKFCQMGKVTIHLRHWAKCFFRIKQDLWATRPEACCCFQKMLQTPVYSKFGLGYHYKRSVPNSLNSS